MKALVLTKNGGTENLVLREIQSPSLKSNEVMITTKAIGINPVDAFVRKYEQATNTYLKPTPGDIMIIGWDISGVITAVGADVKNLKPGDEVFGLVKFPGSGNAYAQYVAAPEDQLAAKPGNITHEEAAAASLAALTAFGTIVTYGNVRKGDRVLIHGAAGGVGHYAIQLAKLAGAYVIGTGSEENRDFILSLGADEFFDYKKTPFENIVQDIDVVVESQPDDHLLRSIKAVKHGGTVISLLTFFEGKYQEEASKKNLTTHRLSVTSNGSDMKAIAGLLQTGKLRSHISKTYSFEDMAKAHEQIETGKTRGKIAVLIK